MYIIELLKKDTLTCFLAFIGTTMLVLWYLSKKTSEDDEEDDDDHFI